MADVARIFGPLWRVAAMLLGVSSTGCALWPFAEKDRTAYVTPAQRVTAIEQIGRQSTGTDASGQHQLTVQLAEQIQTESDPLVREAIIRTAARFRTPLADRMLLAALNDSDAYVRQRACRLVGRRGDASAVAALGQVAKADEDLDVRLAATRALGELRHPSAVAYLSSSLHDTDPALQFAAVESLRLASGQNLGIDVAAWREWVASHVPAAADHSAVAGRPESLAEPRN